VSTRRRGHPDRCRPSATGPGRDRHNSVKEASVIQVGDIREWRTHDVVDTGGHKIGTPEAIYEPSPSSNVLVGGPGVMPGWGTHAGRGRQSGRRNSTWARATRGSSATTGRRQIGRSATRKWRGRSLRCGGRASPPVSPRVVAAILITQNVNVTSGTLLRPCSEFMDYFPYESRCCRSLKLVASVRARPQSDRCRSPRDPTR